MPSAAQRLEASSRELDDPRIDLSPMVPFSTWDDLAAARADPASVGAGPDADAIEGCMIKRADSPYLPGRPKGYWYKWKRDPYLVDAVMMYGQRGHGKRSSLLFGLHVRGLARRTGRRRTRAGRQGLSRLHRRGAGASSTAMSATTRSIASARCARCEYGKDRGLVLEVAFEGLQRSTRHKSGVAMRFPRISRIRWDKPAAEADRLETLERILTARREGNSPAQRR